MMKFIKSYYPILFTSMYFLALVFSGRNGLYYETLGKMFLKKRIMKLTIQ